MLNACAFRVEQMSSIKCRCNRPFETDSCTSIPGPSHCKRPCTFAVGGQTWQALTVAVGGAQPAAPTVQFQGRSATSTRNRVSMSSGTFGSDKHLVGRYARARKTLPQDRRPGDRSVRLPSNKLPEQTWRGRARVGPKRQESHVCSPDTATMGRPKRAMYVRLAIAKVRASSHVLIGERGRTRANTHRHLLLRRREPELAQTLARASLASI